MFYYMDSGFFIFLLPAMLFALLAQARVKSTYKKYSKFNSRKGLTGAEVARMILSSHHIDHVSIEKIKGKLTDHYDPKEKVLRLSKGVYNSHSLAAIGIAAHECGHAIQDDEDYLFLRLRHTMVPVVNFANGSAMPLAFLGIFLGALSNVNGIGHYILQLAIIMFTAVVMFHVVTLPVELNASSRAIAVLSSEGILDEDEIIPAKRVLNAAALTYIAAAAVAFANLLRLILLSRGRD